MELIYAAITVFSLTAILGLYLASLIFRNKSTPKGVAIIHGFFAIAGLVLLIVYCSGHHPGPLASIIAFAIAALGGILLAYKDLTGGQPPKWLAVLHALVAVTGFVLLLLFAFT